MTANCHTLQLTQTLTKLRLKQFIMRPSYEPFYVPCPTISRSPAQAPNSKQVIWSELTWRVTAPVLPPGESTYNVQ